MDQALPFPGFVFGIFESLACGTTTYVVVIWWIKVAALKKAMLETAFDGEDEELVRLLSKAADFMKNEVLDSIFYILLRLAVALWDR